MFVYLYECYFWYLSCVHCFVFYLAYFGFMFSISILLESMLRYYSESMTPSKIAISSICLSFTIGSYEDHQQYMCQHYYRQHTHPYMHWLVYLLQPDTSTWLVDWFAIATYVSTHSWFGSTLSAPPGTVEACCSILLVNPMTITYLLSRRLGSVSYLIFYYICTILLSSCL